MEILEYVLMAALLISSIVIIIAVLFQKSNDEGLSGTIAGGSDTFYGRDKSAPTERALFKWTVIASIVFAVCVLAVYVIQPDFSQSFKLDGWKSLQQGQYSGSYLNKYYNILFK